MHNHHVYVYFRFKSWVAGQTGKYMRQWFMHEFAEKELNAQKNLTPINIFKNETRMKKELENKTKLAEQKIADALQEFHESTGLIPTGIDFEMIDVQTMEEHASGKRTVIVGKLEVRAGI